MQFQEAKDFILDKLRKGLPEHLTYHCVEHVEDVYNAAQRIGKSEGVEGQDMELLLVAALFHDAGFLRDERHHETASCDIAREYLPQFGYQSEAIEKICGMIMATRIPQTPASLLEEITCDADLDYLGRPDYFIISSRLYDELRFSGTINSEKEWNELQVRFLESHRYFTATALKERQPLKDEHLRLIKSKIN